ncbi:MAG: FMN-binding protein [Lachnospiraceae bacterium]|nr:FMN-binding protein [Lachnospiraceae bacterium]
MGIITGYISLISFLLLAAKFAMRKMKIQKMNQFFKRLHKPVSCVFLLSCIIHLILVIPVLKTRNLLVTFSGYLGFGIAILIILLCHMIKDGKKKMFWHRTLTLALLTAVVCHVIVYYMDFIHYKDSIQGIEITEIDISTIPDGNYVGDYNAGYIYAKVQVSVDKGQISDIKIIEHRNERGQKAESIISKIVDEQKLNVDAVSSATNSSLVIKKACENALRQ